MSTSAPASAFDTALPRRSALKLPGWVREPFLHFLILGGVLFAADHLISGGAGNSHVIVIEPEVDGAAIDVFEQSRGRKPTEAELQALRRVWLDNEVLYREGIAMGLEKGDDAIRQRVIFKALSVIDANVRVPEVDDEQLRAWFEQHREKYDEPARYDFQEAALAGDSSESAVRAFVDALNAGTPGDAQAGLRVFKARPHLNLVQSYGEAFSKTLEELPPGQWHALKTRDGWRAMRLDAVTPPRPASYETLRNVILQDWKDATASEQRTAAVRRLATKYRIELAAGTGLDAKPKAASPE